MFFEVPYLLHGDDAPMGKGGRSLRVLQWSSPATHNRRTLMKKLVLAMNLCKMPFARHHEKTIDEVIAWSFTLATKGRWPTCDHLGNTLTKHRAREAGGPLNPHGIIPVYAGTIGDWKFFAETFSLRHTWATEAVCSICEAHKGPGPKCLGNALDDAGWTLTQRTQAEYMGQQVAAESLSPFCLIPGWHIFNMMEDALHDDYLGVRPSLVGSAMLELAHLGIWGAAPAGREPWKTTLDRQLSVAWDSFNHWLHAKNCNCNISPFKHNTISMQTLDNWPELKAKGAACGLVCAWLAPVAEAAAVDNPLPEHSFRAMALTGFDNLSTAYRMKDRSGGMTTAAAQFMEESRRKALLGFHACSKISAEAHRFRYRLTPKFHKLDHLLRRAVRTRLSPSLFWSFADEDMMKWMVQNAGKCHGLGIMQTPLRKWLVFFDHELRDVVSPA